MESEVIQEPKLSVDFGVPGDRPDPRLVNRISILTSILALSATFAGIMSTRCTIRGTIDKNDAIFAQAMAADQWSYYQSRNIRIEIAELFDSLPQARKTGLKEKIDKLQAEKKEIFALASTHAKERDAWNEKSKQYLEVSKTFASALVLLQVAIVLVPLTLLVRKRLLLQTGTLVGSVGLCFLIVAYFQYFRVL